MMTELLQSLNLATAGEMALMAIAVAVVTQAVKQTPLNNRYMPIVAMVIGAVIGLVVAYTQKSDLFGGAFAGLLIGAATSGVVGGSKQLASNPVVAAPVTTVEPTAIAPLEAPTEPLDDTEEVK